MAKPLNPELRAKLLEERRRLYLEEEQDWSDCLAIATRLLPYDARDYLFVFRIRELWMMERGHPADWSRRVTHAYPLMKMNTFTAIQLLNLEKLRTPKQGIDALADLLIGLRKRELRFTRT